MRRSIRLARTLCEEEYTAPGNKSESRTCSYIQDRAAWEEDTYVRIKEVRSKRGKAARRKKTKVDRRMG